MINSILRWFRALVGLLAVLLGLYFMYLNLVAAAMGGGVSTIGFWIGEFIISLGIFAGIYLIFAKNPRKIIYVLVGILFVPITMLLYSEIAMYFDYRVNDEYGILNSGNFERAEEYYSEYIANNETWANENRGDLFYFKGEYQKALLDYQIAGLSGIPYAKQIMTLTKLDQMDKAIDLAEKYNQDLLIGLNVKVHEPVKALALAQNSLSNKVDELKFELTDGRNSSGKFVDMVRTRVNSGEYLQHSYYIRIANIHAQIRNYAEAEKYFALAIKVESDYESVYGKLASESYSALADYYMYIGDLDNATKNYLIAFENSGRSQYKDGLISAYLLKGDLQMATIELDSAFKMHNLGYDPELFDFKKILLEKQQKLSAANAVDKEKTKNKVQDLSTEVKSRITRDIEDLKNEHKLVLDYSDFVRAVSIHE